MTTNLHLDSRQRAMLAEMGVRVWLPDASVTTALVQATQTEVSTSPVSMPASVPVRREPPIRLPVLSSPPVQAVGVATKYVIGNMPEEAASFDYIVLGVPCTGEADKLLASIVKAIGGNGFVAQMVAAHKDEAPLADQLKLLPAKCILALGPHAGKALLSAASEAMPFSKLRGTLHSAEGIASPIVVTYHPLQLLRQPLAKAQTWLDLKIVMKEMK